MAKGPWKRDPETGIPVKWLRLTEYADPREQFNWRAFARDYPDCNIVGTPQRLRDALSIEIDPRDLRRRALTDPSSPFHLHEMVAEIVDDDGMVTNVRTLGWATHTESLHAGWANYKQAADTRQKAGKARTDTSSGSTLPQGVDQASGKGY